MHIEGTFNGSQLVDKKGYHIDATATIELEVKAIPKFFLKEQIKEFTWEISHNSRNVDANDFTGGKKAQLKIYKEHAGTSYNPSKIAVKVSAPNFKQATVFKISAEPKITETQWKTTQCRNLEPVPIYIKQEGLYGEDAVVKIYDQADTSTPIAPTFPIKLNAGTNMVEWRAKNITKKQKKFYYIISYKDNNGQEVVLFDGNKESMLLSVTAIKDDDKERVYPTNLTPVTVYSEEYFTQKYEPCKYTKIGVTIGEDTPVTIFNEEDTASNLSNELKKLILCGNDSKTIKIELTDLKTDECRLVLEGEEETHQSTVFDVTELDEFDIEYTPKEQIKDQLEIGLAYPYEHLDDLWQFLLKYNHITLPLRTIPLILPIRTCRYSKGLRFNLLPDLSWAFHFQWGNPKEHLSEEAKCHFKEQYGQELVDNLQGNKIFYEENQVSLYDKGLVNEIDAITSWIEEQNFAIKQVINLLFGSDVVRSIIFEYLKGASLDFKVGLHALYNYDNEGKNPTDLSYTDEHPWIAKTIVGGAVVVGLVVDVLLLFFTRGKNLPSLLRKAQKVYKFTRSAAGYLGVNTYINEDEGLKIIAPQVAYANGIGFKKQDDGSISLIHEYTLTAAPLFAVSDIKKWDLGKYILQLTGISGFFDNFHKYVGYMQIGETLISPVKGKLKPAKEIEGSAYIKLGSLRDARETAYYAENKMEDTISGFIKKHFGVKVDMIIAFEGFYDAHIQLKTNISTQKFDLFDGISDYLDKSEVTFGKKQGIDGYIKIDATLHKKVEFSKLNQYIPRFLNDWEFADVETNGELSALIKGSLYFERTYTYNPVTASVAALEALVDSTGVAHLLKKEKQALTKNLSNKGIIKMPHYRDNYIFTGLIGEIIVKLKINIDEDEEIIDVDISDGEDDQGNTKPIVMEFIPGFVIPGELVPVFEEPENK